MSQLAHSPKQFLEDLSDSAQERVIAANVDFYRQVAEKYDTYEPYLFDPALQRSLEDDLEKLGSYFVSLGRRPSCLECGGGTGNLTLKMCARGWKVTVVDVSKEMLKSLRGKGLARGFSPTLINASIERFLATCSETYDLIAFSSVLHHLYSYKSVLEQAAAHVCHSGLFYSNYDPVIPRRPLLTRVFASMDIALAKARFDSTDLLPGIKRRIRKLLAPTDPSLNRKIVSAGDVAEYHAVAGIDDEGILQLLRKSRFAVIEHLRYTTGRTATIRSLNKRLRLLQSFKIIARKDI